MIRRGGSAGRSSTPTAPLPREISCRSIWSWRRSYRQAKGPPGPSCGHGCSRKFHPACGPIRSASTSRASATVMLRPAASDMASSREPPPAGPPRCAAGGSAARRAPVPAGEAVVGELPRQQHGSSILGDNTLNVGSGSFHVLLERQSCVALLAKTPGLRIVVRLDWRPMPPVRVCVHSVNRP